MEYTENLEYNKLGYNHIKWLDFLSFFHIISLYSKSTFLWLLLWTGVLIHGTYTVNEWHLVSILQHKLVSVYLWMCNIELYRLTWFCPLMRPLCRDTVTLNPGTTYNAIFVTHRISLKIEIKIVSLLILVSKRSNHNTFQNPIFLLFFRGPRVFFRTFQFPSDCGGCQWW